MNNNKLKIAYIVSSLANSGPNIVVRDLVTAFSKEGHDCVVFYIDDLVELKLPCPIKRISNSDKIDFSKYDIVHSHSMRPDRYIYRNFVKLAKTKYVSTLHSYIPIDLSFKYNRIVSLVYSQLWLKRWLSRHDKLVVLSKDALQYYLNKKFSIERLDYAYNTRSEPDSKVDMEFVARLLNFKGNATLIGICSGLHRLKGIDQCIKALTRLTNYRLVIIGRGKALNELETLANKLCVEDRCLFMGYKKDASLYTGYFDIFAMPSRSEGFGLTLLEAAMKKVPTVCSNLPIFKELFTGDEVSFFELENLSSLCTAIERANSEVDMGERMYKHYNDTYSPQTFYKNYLRIYQETIGAN